MFRIERFNGLGSGIGGYVLADTITAEQKQLGIVLAVHCNYNSLQRSAEYMAVQGRKRKIYSFAAIIAESTSSGS